MSNLKKPSDKKSCVGFAQSALIGTASGVILAFLLALIFSMVALSQENPDLFIAPLAYAALAVGAMVCGIVSMRTDAEHTILSPLLGGTLYSLIMWIVSLFLRGGEQNPISPLWLAVGYALCIGISLLGGLISRPRSKPVKTGKGSPTALMRKQLSKR